MTPLQASSKTPRPPTSGKVGRDKPNQTPPVQRPALGTIIPPARQVFLDWVNSLPPILPTPRIYLPRFNTPYRALGAAFEED